MKVKQWRELLLETSRVILAQDQPDNDDVNRLKFAPEIHGQVTSVLKVRQNPKSSPQKSV